MNAVIASIALALVSIASTASAGEGTLPGSRADVQTASQVTGLAAAVEVGMIAARAQQMMEAGASDAAVRETVKKNILRVGLLKKISLVGLAYIVGDYTGTKIYENLSPKNQEALGEIVHLMVENAKAKIGMKATY